MIEVFQFWPEYKAEPNLPPTKNRQQPNSGGK